MELTAQAQAILDRIPAEHKAAAYAILIEYGTGMLAMAREEAVAYVERIRAGDLEAVRTLLMAGGWDALLDAARANTARWDRVAEHNVQVAQMTRDALLKAAPILVSILLGMAAV